MLNSVSTGQIQGEVWEGKGKLQNCSWHPSYAPYQISGLPLICGKELLFKCTFIQNVYSTIFCSPRCVTIQLLQKRLYISVHSWDNYALYTSKLHTVCDSTGHIMTCASSIGYAWHRWMQKLRTNVLLPLQNKYKEASKKQMQSGSFTTLPQTRETAHGKEMSKLVSEVSFLGVPSSGWKVEKSGNKT